MNAVYANGSLDVLVPAGQKIALYSLEPTKLSQSVGHPNQPSVWDLVAMTTGGTEYLSSAFTYATTVRIEPSASLCYYEVGAAPSIFDPSGNLSMSAVAATITGLAAAQGGSVTVKGGTSSTAGNAGGAAALLGGQPGATGAGGAATVTGGAGGATSGTGGAATVTAGAGTNGNAAGGVASVVGGAGQGTGAGGAAALTGGASGAGATGNGGAAGVTGGAAASTNGAGGAASVTGGAGAGTGNGGAGSVVGGASGTGATGNGGAVNLTGGAAGSTNGNGGNIAFTPGAKAGSGYNGIIRNAGAVAFKASNATEATVAGAGTLTEAQCLGGVVYQDTDGGSIAFNLPAIATFLGYFPSLAIGEGVFLRSLGKHSSNTSTLTAGAGYTTYGALTATSTGATYLIVRTAAATADVIRVG